MRTIKNLREYQKRSARRIYAESVELMVDIGLGKTISAMTGARGLMRAAARRSKRRRALVVMPLRVLGTETWQDEAKLWAHTKDMTFAVVHGKEPVRLAALREDVDFYLINYENLKWLAKMVGTASKPRPMARWLAKMGIDILLVDEASYLKNGNSMRFKALKFRLMRLFKSRVLLTGSPMPNSLLEMWSQTYVIDYGDRLGRSQDRFKQRFFEQADYQGYKWEMREGALEKVLDLIKDLTLRLDNEDWIKMPRIVPNTILVEFPPKIRRLYQTHEDEYFSKLSGQRTITAVNAATLGMQCWQICNGAIYPDDEDRVNFEELHSAKLDALEDLTYEHLGQQLLVGYWFKHDMVRLQKRFKRAIVMTKDNSKQAISSWNKGNAGMMLMPMGSGVEGMNLQHGGHIIVYFSQTWSSEKHDQLLGRLRRPDQVSESILPQYIVVRNTIDEVMRDVVLRKQGNQKRAMDYLREYEKQRSK